MVNLQCYAQLCSLMQSYTQADQDHEASFSSKDCKSAKQYLSVYLKLQQVFLILYFKNTQKNCKIQFFLQLELNSKSQCQLIDEKYQDIDFTTQDQQQCLSISEYTYSWNTSKNKCSSCNGDKDNQTNQTTNHINSSTKR
ncbi:unnamed protein product [Paramecium sonneborni]|uniref:Uncharacterized protein n=1 Tax=Paramecium sonneborni TaxID=65129 RepID=A0A8S1RJA4_9CILI|nr:unnamed protein product [Paramecium sonneborni]